MKEQLLRVSAPFSYENFERVLGSGLHTVASRGMYKLWWASSSSCKGLT